MLATPLLSRHPAWVIKLVQECGWQHQTSCTAKWQHRLSEGGLLGSMARQAAVRPASPPVSHHAACTRLCYTPATQRPMLCFSRMSSPFALSVNSSSWAEWTEALTASQHNKHTHPRIHRLHSAPCLEMAPSHSIQYGNGHIVLQDPLRSLSRSLSCRRKELPLLHIDCSPLLYPPPPPTAQS